MSAGRKECRSGNPGNLSFNFTLRKSRSLWVMPPGPKRQHRHSTASRSRKPSSRLDREHHRSYALSIALVAHTHLRRSSARPSSVWRLTSVNVRKHALMNSCVFPLYFLVIPRRVSLRRHRPNCPCQVPRQSDSAIIVIVL